MKKKYKHIDFKQFVFVLIFGLVSILLPNVSSAQVFKPFQQRTSSQAPDNFKNKSIYNLRGDFKMIGNTNLRVSGGTGADTESNSNTSMVLVDTDGVSSTTNSSMAQLVLPANCTNIVYAGLYWSGRRNNSDNSSTSNTSDYTSSSNIQSTGLTLTTTTSGNDNNGYIIYTLKNNNNSIYYEFTLSYNDIVQYRTSPSGIYITIPNNQLSNSDSGNSSSGKRTVSLLQPIIFNVGSQVVTINNLQRRRSSPITNSGSRGINITVVTNNAGSSNKIKAKIRKDTGVYTDLVADDYFIGGSGQDGIFTAYKDVTNYVRTNGGAGNYWIADLDLNGGNGSSVGYFGGWGMVIIYENPNMKWRDITVFDGYAYVSGGNAYNLPLSGFRAAQNGAIKVDMGMMAGEGDRSITGDAFRIRNAANTAWIDLSHANNTTNNFFNSSILTDGNRNPNLNNNTGLDIVNFEIPNTDKSIIKNEQTSTTFQYANNGGGGQDTYVIYNIVFAVDAYVPEAEGVNLPSSIYVPAYGSNSAQTITDPSAIAYRMNHLQPGDEVTMDMKIYNYGNERIENGIININIPNAMRLIKATRVNTSGTTHITGTGSNNFSQPGWKSPVLPNAITPGAITSAVAYDGGVINWNLGIIPMQALPAGVTSRVPLSTLSYTLKVTNDCAKLRSSNDECILSPQINGEILGTGENSKAPLNPLFIIKYDDTCSQAPIYGFTDFIIDPSPEFLANCSDKLVGDELFLEYFCSIPTGTTIPRATIANYYPAGTKFYKIKPTTTGYASSIVNGDFSITLTDVIENGAVVGKETRFFAMLPETTNEGCYYNIHIFVSQITSKPETVNFTPVCLGQPYNLPVSLSATGQAKGLTLVYFTSSSSNTPLATPPAPTASGSYTYYAAESGSNGSGPICYGDKVPFTITILDTPSPLILTNVELCTFSDYVSTINSNGATATWEYYNGATWGVVNTQLAGVAIVANQLKITKAPATLNGIKFRVKLTNTNNCSSVSNEMTLTVKGCQMPVNPMIYTPLKR